MEWREADGVRWLESRLPGATAAFTTRTAGSLKDGHERAVAAIGIASARVFHGRQVHGAQLAFHESSDAATGPVEVDGHVIRSPGMAGLVYTADCLPVAVAGPGGAAILHCGWRGLAAGIVARGVEAVDATAAAVGPGIGPCCYEVGDEVLAAFSGLDDGVSSGRMLDLPEAARQQLRRAGVEEVEVAGLCTRCEEGLLFSHRRDGGPGRQGGLVWLTGEGP
ncbi:MAG TPA: polyphenol oxidase family protein [Solirubrobacterales bacterium]|nr:polyphenol oxidase family protein [Solirubrobacterales bacterium]